jgi:outer membrane protein assembly factor BamB
MMAHPIRRTMRLAAPAGLILALAGPLAAPSPASASPASATQASTSHTSISQTSTSQATALAAGPGGSWTVYHHDRAGSGVAGALTRVDTSSRKWTSPALDGDLYGEPLISGGRVYVATQNNTVYALSAATGKVAWATHLGAAVPASHLPCGDISPTVGITGTPVIDPARHEIFAVADLLVGGKPAHRLVGLSTITGARMLTVGVDPAGSTPSALLQRTGLTLTAGKVVFGFGGNFGDCSTYRGRLVAVPETGGAARFFTVDAAPGESQGAIWMGGGAPAVDTGGNLWVTVGNGSVTSASHPFDYSDSVLQVSPSMRLRRYFAPVSWAADNAADLDFSTEPALLSNGQVVAAGKAGIAYLLSGTSPGGLGGQQATLHGVCDQNIDGGGAVVGRTVYLPCLSGIVSVRAAASPPSLHLVWRSGNGSGPPIIAAHLIWTISHDGTLYALDPATGKVRQRVSIGAPANHFPTPAAGDGLLVAPSARHVVAFTALATADPTTASSPPTASPSPAAGSQAPTRPASGNRTLTVVIGIVLVGLIGTFLYFRRPRHQ